MKMGFPSREQVEILRIRYPVGTRLELDHMEDNWAVPSGTNGTVKCIDSAGQIHVAWDNGRSLALIPGVDSFHKIQQEQSMGGMKL